jgi:hypothetical protein
MNLCFIIPTTTYFQTLARVTLVDSAAHFMQHKMMNPSFK